MFSMLDFLIIWCSVAIPMWAGALYLGKRLDRMSYKISNMNKLTACGKPIKSKKVIRGNDK